MIKKDNKIAIGLINGKKVAVEAYTIVNGVAKLVWQAVRSCFGSGMWINNKPWLNNEGWRNN